VSETEIQIAQRRLVIQDVYICKCEFWADKEYEPTAQVKQSPAQSKVEPEPDVQIIEIPDSPKNPFVVKYFVGTGIRLLKENSDKNPDAVLAKENLLASIQSTFIARYGVLGTERPTKAMLDAFSDNAVHHVWPYWRELLQATMLRLRLSPIMLPMRVVRRAPTVPKPQEAAPSVVPSNN
jgi:hypothetical protein